MISRLFKKLFRFAWLLPGFVLWSAFPPLGERAGVLFALVPLLAFTRISADGRRTVRTWFLSALVFWVATLSWMPAIVKNGGPWPLVVLGWGALAAYCAAYGAAFGYLTHRYWRWANAPGAGLWRRGVGILVVEPVLWAGLELVRSRLGGGFAWNQLGVVAANSAFAAPARFGGVYLLSALIVLVNGTFAGIVERIFTRRRSFGAFETVIPLALVVGSVALARHSETLAPESAGELSLALVQRDFPCVFRADDRVDPYAVYSNLTAAVAAFAPDLTVSGESALAEVGAIGRPEADRFAVTLANLTRSRAVLLGGARRTETGEYNSAALYALAADGGFYRSVYDKVHLVPFGEFIPGDKLFPALQRLAPVGSCTPGELRLLSLPLAAGGELPLGVAICFEDTDSAQVRQLARLGARLLVFITNDSWFSESEEAWQHAWQATARAIETGLPVVRVGNSGVTGTIAPTGRCDWLADAGGRPLVDAPGTMCTRVAPGAAGALTPYVRVGDRPLALAFALLILAMIMVKYAKYEKRRSVSL